MSLLNEIEPLKQTALTELQAAPDLATLEQAKGAWVGPHGKFTALMKQLGSLTKEERPAAGKLINAAKAELETALGARREELELKAALPKPLGLSLVPDAVMNQITHSIADWRIHEIAGGFIDRSIAAYQTLPARRESYPAGLPRPVVLAPADLQIDRHRSK